MLEERLRAERISHAGGMNHVACRVKEGLKRLDHGSDQTVEIRSGGRHWLDEGITIKSSGFYNVHWD